MIKNPIKSDIGQMIISGLVVAFGAKVMDKYLDMTFMKSIWQTFFVELWPIWMGLLGTLICWLIRFVIDVYRIKKTYRTLINWVDELEKKLNQNIIPRIEELEKPAKIEILKKAMFPKKDED